MSQPTDHTMKAHPNTSPKKQIPSSPNGKSLRNRATSEWYATIAVFVGSMVLGTAPVSAALIANGGFNSALDTTWADSSTSAESTDASSGTSQYSLDESTGNLLANESTDTELTTTVNQWLVTAIRDAPSYIASGGNPGGAMSSIGGDGGRVNLRAALQFSEDSKATTGLNDFNIDVFLTTGTAAFYNVELYAWNDGDTGVALTVGGPSGGGYNTSTFGAATTILNNVVIDISDVTADTWTTVSLATDVDLGTGYDFYAWRIGHSNNANDDMRFDNVSVVPEPSTIFLTALGLGGLALRRRRA